MPKQLTELQKSLETQLRDGLHLIPEHMQRGVVNYVVHRVCPGGFLYAVLTNDFAETVGRADDINGRCLRGWAQFMFWHVPMAARGSESRVSNWLASGPRTCASPKPPIAADQPE